MNLPEFTPDSIIFDLDGTLWNATSVTVESWPQVLDRHPGVTPAIPLDEANICRHMGLTNEELGAVFFPTLPPGEQMTLMDESCAYENRTLAERGGVLYPKVPETLAALSRHFPLFVVSNCQDGYIECFLTANGGGAYIRDHECSGRTKLTKAENICLIMERNGLCFPVYVGDTTSDSVGAAGAGIPLIYAKYGFGETYGRGRVTEYRYSIDAIEELSALIPGRKTNYKKSSPKLKKDAEKSVALDKQQEDADENQRG